MLYVSWPEGPAFINVVNDRSVTLSPVAGAPPRDSYDALVLEEHEEHSANCYVRVAGKVWFAFGGNGWAPQSAFHLAPEEDHSLPERC